MNTRIFIRNLGLGLCLAAFATASAAQENTPNFSGEVHDAWLQGKVETVLLLNRHLNNFKIDTEVQGDVVALNGEVTTPI